MNINLTAKPMERPKGMSLKAQLMWDYLELDGGRGWVAAKTVDDVILLVDEGRNIADASVFVDESDFVYWLETAAEDHIANENDWQFFDTWVDRRVLTPEVRAAVIAALNADIEEREEAEEAEQDG